MTRGRRLVAILVASVGVVWIGQGLGLLRGSSFMVDDVRWAVVGVLMLVGGVVLGVMPVGRRPPPP